MCSDFVPDLLYITAEEGTMASLKDWSGTQGTNFVAAPSTSFKIVSYVD
jgi:hypothetical protein